MILLKYVNLNYAFIVGGSYSKQQLFEIQNQLFRHCLIPLTWAIVSVMVKSQTTAPVPATEQTTILWSLAPCQSAFWIPSTSSEFTQNWITYQYEGNPLSQFGKNVLLIL